MIKIYGMGTCPDCTQVEEQVKGNAKYELSSACGTITPYSTSVSGPAPSVFLASSWKMERLL